MFSWEEGMQAAVTGKRFPEKELIFQTRYIFYCMGLQTARY